MKKTGSIFIQGFENYINTELISRPNDDYFFREIEEFASENTIPILSPASGKILSKLVEWFQPESILELGTGAGYSLHWMVSRAKNHLDILTMDRNRHIFSIVKDFWERSPYKNLHEVRFQPGFIVEQLKDGTVPSWEFDFVFIDSDKVTYPDLIQHFLETFSKRNRKQILVFDNVLWHGRIANPDPTKTSDTALLEFWNIVKTKNLDATLLPSGDGLLMIELESSELFVSKSF